MSIGFTTHHGSVTAAADWGAPAERKHVLPSRADSHEALLHACGIERFFLPLRGTRAAAQALREPRLERAIGVIYRPQTERQSHYFFARLAAHWKRAYTQHEAGWTAWVLSPDMKLPGAMRLKESRRVPMWNGPIECRLFRFDLVAGSARPARIDVPS